MTLNIFTGNIGSGKSLIASKLAKMGQVIVNMDSIQQMIGGGEYGNYDSRKKEVYHAAEESIIDSALKSGLSVVVDRTNMDRKRRERFIAIGKRHGAEIASWNWGRGNASQINRRIANDHGIPHDQWRSVFEYMAKSYERPTLEEGFDHIIEPPKRFTFHAFDFDGTLVENAFPSIGEIISGKVDELNTLWNDLSNIIIIWTCRSGDYENQARQFLIKNKIPFDFINENPMFDMGSPKIFAHYYHDDRNAN